jgi:hypothetical protein
MKFSFKEHLKSIVAVLIVVGIVLGFFFGTPLVLNTSVPIRVVESGSMCIPYGRVCDGWSHPFDRTLHVGDIIIVQGIDPDDLNTNYPNSDIIVYKNPVKPSATPIVHRIVSSYEVNGTLYFQTKGDGNGTPWPAAVDPSEYDSNSGIILTGGEGVPASLVESRVVMRIPWFGNVTLFLQKNPWGLSLIFLVIVLLVVVEFVLPLVRKKVNSANSVGS